MVSHQFITNRGIDELRTWLEEGYDTIQDWDKEYSDWFFYSKVNQDYISKTKYGIFTS